MKLTENERIILSTLQYDADGSIADLAKKVGMREHVVRRAKSRLFEAGVIQRRVYVNYFAIGLSQYSIYFAIASQSRNRKEQIRKRLLAAPFLELILELGGRFDFAVVLTVRSPADVETFFDFVTNAGAVAFTDTQLHVRTGGYFFGVKYLTKLHTVPVDVNAPVTHLTRLDKTDYAVVEVYNKSLDGNRLHMARALGMPLSTLQYRIQQLYNRGVITGVFCQIAPDLIGYEAFRVLVSTRHPLRTYRSTLFNWAKKHPSVVTFMHGIGRWDYEFRIETKDTKEARQVVDDLLDNFSEFLQLAELISVTGVLKMNRVPDLKLLNLNF